MGEPGIHKVAAFMATGFVLGGCLAVDHRSKLNAVAELAQSSRGQAAVTGAPHFPDSSAPVPDRR